MADLKKRVEKLETEEKVKQGQRGLRVIVSDAGREPSRLDDICIKAITDEWSSRATARFVIQVIDIGRIPTRVSPETERLLLIAGWRHAETLQNGVPGNSPDIVRKQEWAAAPEESGQLTRP